MKNFVKNAPQDLKGCRHQRQGLLVLNSDVIQPPIGNTRAQRAILLLHEEETRTCRTSAEHLMTESLCRTMAGIVVREPTGGEIEVQPARTLLSTDGCKLLLGKPLSEMKLPLLSR